MSASSRSERSVRIFRHNRPLQEIGAVVAHPVDQPVLQSDASRPAAFEDEPKWLRLADTLKRIAQNGFHQFEHTECRDQSQPGAQGRRGTRSETPAARVTLHATKDFPPQCSDGAWLLSSALGASKRRTQSPPVLGGAKQVRCFDEPGEFTGRSEGHIARPYPPHDHDLQLDR